MTGLGNYHNELVEWLAGDLSGFVTLSLSKGESSV